MRIIEPCCAVKHLMQLRDAIGKSGTTEFEYYGDLSITELLPAILTRYSETDVVISSPTIPDQASEIIATWMKKQWACMRGNGKLDVIHHLTIMSDLSRKKSPVANSWKRNNPFANRLTLVDNKQSEPIILLPDFAIIGFRNMCYGGHYIATATTDESIVRSLWERVNL